MTFLVDGATNVLPSTKRHDGPRALPPPLACLCIRSEKGIGPRQKTKRLAVFDGGAQTQTRERQRSVLMYSTWNTFVTLIRKCRIQSDLHTAGMASSVSSTSQFVFVLFPHQDDRANTIETRVSMVMKMTNMASPLFRVNLVLVLLQACICLDTVQAFPSTAHQHRSLLIQRATIESEVAEGTNPVETTNDVSSSVPYTISRGDGSTGGGGLPMPKKQETEDGLVRPKVRQSLILVSSQVVLVEKITLIFAHVPLPSPFSEYFIPYHWYESGGC